ncbi:ceramidase domain-containing protein [Kaarinaea lacus]
MNSYLDHYCERVAPQLWNEPFNVVSNLAFLVVAIFIFRLLSRFPVSSNRRLWDLWLLTGLVVAIGIGSSIWHLFATSWTLWADRIPILLFISIFLISCLIRIFRLAPLIAFALFVLFQAVNIAVQLQYPPETLNGSIFYVPTLALLVAITIILWQKNYSPIKNHFLVACGLFNIAIIFRSIDLVACDVFPVGTHFLWHILVASTIYPLILGLVNFANTVPDNEQ